MAVYSEIFIPLDKFAIYPEAPTPSRGSGDQYCDRSRYDFCNSVGIIGSSKADGPEAHSVFAVGRDIGVTATQDDGPEPMRMVMHVPGVIIGVPFVHTHGPVSKSKYSSLEIGALIETSRLSP